MADLTTREKVKGYLGISGTTHDDIIDSLISDVSSQVEVYCNRNFLLDSYVEYFDTEAGDSKVFVSNHPMGTAVTVSYRQGAWGDPTWELFNVNDYLISPEMGKIAFAMRFASYERYIKVDYTGGYLIDFNNETDITRHTLPRDLSFLVTEMVSNSYNIRKTSGILSESTEGQSITYTTGTSRDMTKNGDYSNRLMRYRNINI